MNRYEIIDKNGKRFKIEAESFEYDGNGNAGFYADKVGTDGLALFAFFNTPDRVILVKKNEADEANKVNYQLLSSVLEVINNTFCSDELRENFKSYVESLK